MTPSAATLLQAWETGAGAAPADRLAALLCSLEVIPSETTVDALTVGQCDARLFEVRRSLFGEELDVVATCPECRQELELALKLGELQPPLSDCTPDPVSVTADGYTVRCRIPTNADLRALTDDGEEAILRRLIARCALDVRDGDGRPAGLDEVPASAIDAIARAVAESDPGSFTTLRILCPCGTEWLDELDIRAVVWTDLTDWLGGVLNEVNHLALAYGWSEGEILAMAGWRRRWYLEAIG